MDKFDFYRELLDEYAFDKEKIYKNAKQGKLAGKKRFPIGYIAIPAAAAVVVVTVGTLLITHFGKPNNVTPPISSGSLAALTDQERLDKFKDEIIKNEGSKELYNALVTFTRPLPPVEAQAVLLAHAENSVPVKILYLEDGTRVYGSDEVGAVFRGGNVRISGAVIKCAGYLMARLDNDSRVLAVEILDDSDIDIISPIKTDGSDNGNSEPVENSSTESSQPDNVTVIPPENSESIKPPVDNPPVFESYELDNRIFEADSGKEPVYSAVNSSAAIPEEILQRLPEGVVLPDTVHKFTFVTESTSAERAYFLNDTVFYVKTADSVCLYEFADGTALPVCDPVPCPDAKAFFVSERGSVLMVIGSDGKILRIDADSREIRVLDAENMTGSGTAVEAAYNESSDALALNILDNGEYSLRIASISSGLSETLYSGTEKFTLLAADGKNVYFALYSGASLNIYRAASGEGARLVCSVDGKYDALINAAFTHAVIKGRRTYIFDPASESLIAAGDGDISFGISAHGLSCGGEYFIIDGGALIPSGGLSIISQIDFKSSLSKYYTAFPENGAVRIVDSSYTDKAKNEYLTFETVSENASAEIRGAVNAAAALQNMLAENILADCGIDSSEKLNDAITACFTESAGAELTALFIGSENGSRPIPIDISDTVLVISEESDGTVNGTLYINAGSFGGRTAYYSCAVRLLLTEDGIYKADRVIG